MQSNVGARTTCRVNFDYQVGSFQALVEGIRNHNATLRRNHPKLTISMLGRSLMGSWTRGRV
jgi:hypothetical protein